VSALSVNELKEPVWITVLFAVLGTDSHYKVNAMRIL